MYLIVGILRHYGGTLTLTSARNAFWTRSHWRGTARHCAQQHDAPFGLRVLQQPRSAFIAMPQRQPRRGTSCQYLTQHISPSSSAAWRTATDATDSVRHTFTTRRRHLGWRRIYSSSIRRRRGRAHRKRLLQPPGIPHHGANSGSITWDVISRHYLPAHHLALRQRSISGVDCALRRTASLP